MNSQITHSIKLSLQGRELLSAGSALHHSAPRNQSLLNLSFSLFNVVSLTVHLSFGHYYVYHVHFLFIGSIKLRNNSERGQGVTVCSPSLPLSIHLSISTYLFNALSTVLAIAINISLAFLNPTLLTPLSPAPWHLWSHVSICTYTLPVLVH